MCCFFFLLRDADSARSEGEKCRSSDSIIPKQMVENEAGWGDKQLGDLHVANLTLALH